MTTNNNVNFKSRPLHQANLRNASGGLVRAVISELDPKNDGDIEAMQKIADNWHGAKYAREMNLSFLDAASKPNQKYYAIESQEPLPLHQRILGYAKTQFIDNYSLASLDFSLVQTRPDIMLGDGIDNMTRKIKGVGEALLGQAFRRAKEIEAPCVTITSANDTFYYKTFKNAGVELVDERLYDNSMPLLVNSGDYEAYLSYIKQKYGT